MSKKSNEDIVATLRGKLQQAEKRADDADASLKKLGTRLKGVQGNLERQTRELSELREANELAQREVQILSETPHHFARILRVEEGNFAITIQGAELKRVKIKRSVDRELLSIGRLVYVQSERGTVLDVAPEKNDSGLIYTYARSLDDGVVVEDESGHGKKVWLKEGLNAKYLTNGEKVIVSHSFLTQIVEADKRDALGFASQFALKSTGVTYDDVAGLEDVVNNIKWKIRAPFERPDLFDDYQLEPRLMACLSGPPGNGKTTLAQAIANDLLERHKDALGDAAVSNFIYISGPQLSHWLVGRGEHQIRSVLEGAQRLFDLTSVPVAIYFDDIDSFFRERGSRSTSGANEDYVNQFNAAIEGARKLRGVYIFLATNRRDIIDTATLDRMHSLQVYIPPPDTPERIAAVLRVHLKDNVVAAGQNPILAVSNRIFQSGPDNNVLQVRFRGDSNQMTYRLHQFMSGRFLRSVTDAAKEFAIRRDFKIPKGQSISGVSEADMIAAFEEKIETKVFPQSIDKVQEWLFQRQETRSIERITPLRNKGVQRQIKRQQERMRNATQ